MLKQRNTNIWYMLPTSQVLRLSHFIIHSEIVMNKIFLLTEKLLQFQNFWYSVPKNWRFKHRIFQAKRYIRGKNGKKN